ncbi:rhodanese-like domain-containing protein, partial [Klebsiella pneumoniae]|nr:rhodanese-like domain-containing protein [Klebsiella pneumoniae]
THLASLDSLVHPHQMEVQEFASYALVIDARSAEAYREDHLPGAVNVPVAADRLADAQFRPIECSISAVAGEAAPSMPYLLAVQVEP